MSGDSLRSQPDGNLYLFNHDGHRIGLVLGISFRNVVVSYLRCFNCAVIGSSLALEEHHNIYTLREAVMVVGGKRVKSGTLTGSKHSTSVKLIHSTAPGVQ